jgi:hypothetical protein
MTKQIPFEEPAATEYKASLTWDKTRQDGEFLVF